VTGFEAISHHNGWAMAVAGALIVFSGLVVLSFIISQIHRLMPLLERKKAPETAPEAPSPARPVPPHDFPLNAADAALLYHPLIEQLGDTFNLFDLYQKSRNAGFPHPHLTISALRSEGYLKPLGNGIYKWQLDQTNPS